MTSKKVKDGGLWGADGPVSEQKQRPGKKAVGKGRTDGSAVDRENAKKERRKTRPKETGERGRGSTKRFWSRRKGGKHGREKEENEVLRTFEKERRKKGSRKQTSFRILQQRTTCSLKRVHARKETKKSPKKRSLQKEKRRGGREEIGKPVRRRWEGKGEGEDRGFCLSITRKVQGGETGKEEGGGGKSIQLRSREKRRKAGKTL